MFINEYLRAGLINLESYKIQGMFCCMKFYSNKFAGIHDTSCFNQLNSGNYNKDLHMSNYQFQFKKLLQFYWNSFIK